MVLLQEWPVICYNEPCDVDPQSPETSHERSLPVQMAPLSSRHHPLGLVNFLVPMPLPDVAVGRLPRALPLRGPRRPRDLLPDLASWGHLVPIRGGREASGISESGRFRGALG